MSLLLCKKEAAQPFYSEKLDLRLWTMQELCYVIYNHPLLAARDLAGEELGVWLRDELSMGFLAARIEKLRALGEAENRDTTDEILIAILEDCNYYAPAEVEACGRRLSAYRSCSTDERMHAEGISLFRLRRYRLSEECFLSEEKLLSERIRKSAEEREQTRLLKRKASLYCDLAAICARLFETERAERFLARSEETAPSERAAKMRFLLRGAEDGAVGSDDGHAKTKAQSDARLTDEEKNALLLLREDARRKALSGRGMQDLAAIFELDPVKREALCREKLREWKKDYRRMK